MLYGLNFKVALHLYLSTVFRGQGYFPCMVNRSEHVKLDDAPLQCHRECGWHFKMLQQYFIGKL